VYEIPQTSRHWHRAILQVALYIPDLHGNPSVAILASRGANAHFTGKHCKIYDLIAAFLLAQRLPDTTAMHLEQFPTAQACWSILSQEYTAKRMYTQNDLEDAFLEMRCPQGGFLTTLRHKQEQLVAAGVQISNKDYWRTVLRGIPDELATFTSQLLTATRSADPTTDRPHLRGSGPAEEPAQAESATLRRCEGGGGRGPRGQRTRVREEGSPGQVPQVWQAGHYAGECCAPVEMASEAPAAQRSLGAQARPETKPVGSANLAIVNEGDGLWMVGAVDPPTDHHWSRSANGRAHDGADPDNFWPSEPDPLLGEASDRDEEATRTQLEGAELADLLDESLGGLRWRRWRPPRKSQASRRTRVLASTRAVRGQASCHARDPSRLF
jgi:hypothetical protein